MILFMAAIAVDDGDTDLGGAVFAEGFRAVIQIDICKIQTWAILGVAMNTANPRFGWTVTGPTL